MSRPLSGKRYFEALGRSAQSRGLPMNYERSKRSTWPMWARCAWTRGWLYQQTRAQATEDIVQSFVREARARGVSLRQYVTEFLDQGARHGE